MSDIIIQQFFAALHENAKDQYNNHNHNHNCDIGSILLYFSFDFHMLSFEISPCDARLQLGHMMFSIDYSHDKQIEQDVYDLLYMFITLGVTHISKTSRFFTTLRHLIPYSIQCYTYVHEEQELKSSEWDKLVSAICTQAALIRQHNIPIQIEYIAPTCQHDTQEQNDLFEHMRVASDIMDIRDFCIHNNKNKNSKYEFA